MPLNHSSEYAELTDEQFLIIGKIVIEFSNMEFLLGVLASRLLITPAFLGRVYASKINASSLQEIILNALDIHEHRYNSQIVSLEQLEEAKRLIHRISQVRVARNSFAHYCWARSSDTEILGSKLSGYIPKKDKPNKDVKIVTNQELLDTYKAAYSIVENLNELINALPEFGEDNELLRKFTLKDNNSFD